MALLKDNKLEFSTQAARNGYFFPMAIGIPDLLHGLFNALQETLQASELWNDFEPLLKETVTLLGDQKWRRRFMAVCMASASANERKELHHFSGHKLDWRWEVLEVLSRQVVTVWPILRKYFDHAAITNDNELRTGLATTYVQWNCLYCFHFPKSFARTQTTRQSTSLTLCWRSHM